MQRSGVFVRDTPKPEPSKKQTKPAVSHSKLLRNHTSTNSSANGWPTQTTFDRLPTENKLHRAGLSTLEIQRSPPNPLETREPVRTLTVATSTPEHTDQQNRHYENSSMGVREYLEWIIELAPLSEAKKDEVRSDIQWLDDGQPNQPTVEPFFGPPEAEFCQERLEELVLHCFKLQTTGRGLTGITSDDLRGVKRVVDVGLEQWNQAHTARRRNALLDLLICLSPQGGMILIIPMAVSLYKSELLDVSNEALVSFKKYLDKQEC